MKPEQSLASPPLFPDVFLRHDIRMKKRSRLPDAGVFFIGVEEDRQLERIGASTRKDSARKTKPSDELYRSSNYRVAVAETRLR